MDQLTPQDFWTGMVVQRPVMETSRVMDCAPALGGLTHSCRSDRRLDGRKTGATLLVIGVFLILVGVIFTTAGWRQYLQNPTFEWIQLLGPILISVGGTFTLTSVCKFGIIYCWPCKQLDEGANAAPAMEPTSVGQPFTLSGVNQPIVLQGAQTMLCIPPVYNLRTQDVCQVLEFQADRSVSGADAADPPPDYVCCVDGAVTAGEDASASSTETQQRGNR